ncbi:uncharacterized protein LOC131656654 isoform X1 [Vicia villosa]|uniref:uncharacterized protein LOC131656654 isoform X1 n=1 Tax=Vicia villosa TaxID=3911 RepID=UPI00273CED6F|nr:uncharacterized protein LOC131656654 isoform X1 [Vicia villosa]
MAHNMPSLSEAQFSPAEERVELSPPELNDDEVKEFRNLVMQHKWKDVIEKYEKDINYHKINIIGRGTALHMAVNKENKKVVKILVKAITDLRNERSLKIPNERGATPLHLAAYRGFTDLCEVIIGKEGERKYLIKEENDDGETPLFWAVLGHKKLVFVYLQQFHPLDLNIVINKNKTSILHVAIQREMFDLAIIIMYFYKGLISTKDSYGTIPLEILASRTSAFPDRYKLSWWKNILFYCFTTSRDDVATTMKLFSCKDEAKENAKNVGSTNPYRRFSPRVALEGLGFSFGLGHHRTRDPKGSKPLGPELPPAGPTLSEGERHCCLNMPLYTVKDLEKEYKIPNSEESFFAWSILSLLGMYIQRSIVSLLGFKEIKTIKKKQIYGYQLLEKFMKEPIDSYMGGGDDRPPANTDFDRPVFQEYQEIIEKKGKGDTTMQETPENKKLENSKNNDGKDTTFSKVVKSGIAVDIKYDKKVKSDEKDTEYLIAASHGIVGMMVVLELNIESVIDETNSNNENALLLAVKNRQPDVIQHFRNILLKGVFVHLSQQIDKSENTMLHLAAYTSEQRKNTWKISGVAMQMMWDIKWYKYIKEITPEYFQNRLNKDGHTPSEIFKTTHEEILKSSVEWLKDTAESCSVVAALIAGVSFATSGSVPGGNQQTGEPTLEGQPAFEGFAISSLIGLYFSGTALIMFLAILTSRKEIKDFRINLPVQLLLGLSSLFVSIVAMFVSFCAGHFFVLTDKYTKGGILFYLYISICLPVTFYAIVQVPLFIDLLTIILKKIPPPSVKGVHL